MTSSTSRGASLSLLKREAAARGPGARRAPARDAVARLDESDDRGDDDVRGGESANPRAPRSGRRGERNASVYNRLLRESRRPPRATATANEVSAAPVVPEPPRVSRGDAGGHTTTEDEGGGYWANTEPDDGGTTDARDEPERDHGEVTSGRAAARRAWIDAGGSPEFVPVGAANRTRRERVDESEDPEDPEDPSSEDPSSEASSEDPSEASSGSSASSEDSTYVPSGADASSESAEKSESRFETPSDSPSASRGDADASTTSSESVARGDSARNDPDPDDVDVAATLRADNRELRRKLREAASTLSAAAKERVSSEAERARLRRELRDGEANRRRAEEEWSRREAELVGAKTGALRAKATAEARAKSAERRSERGRKHSEQAEARVAAAERRAKDANRRAEEAERRAATVEEDLARARDALALMTETAEEARAEAKAMAVWRIEQGPQETAAPAASTPPPVASTDAPRASTAAEDETSNRERATVLAEELASLRAALAGELAAAKRAEQDSERLRARVTQAESDARAAWFALHAERSRPRDTFPAAPETTPPPGPAAELLSLVSPSLLSESDDAVDLAAQAAALDKVVSHLNARRMKRTSGGGGVGSNSNGVAARTSRFPDARAARFFCFKYWQELARTPLSPGTPSSTGDAFAFDVARGESSVTSRGMPWSSGRGTSPRGGAAGATS